MTTDVDKLAAHIQAAIDADPLLARALRPRRIAGSTVAQLELNDRFQARLRRALALAGPAGHPDPAGKLN